MPEFIQSCFKRIRSVSRHNPVRQTLPCIHHPIRKTKLSQIVLNTICIARPIAYSHGLTTAMLWPVHIWCLNHWMVGWRRWQSFTRHKRLICSWYHTCLSLLCLGLCWSVEHLSVSDVDIDDSLSLALAQMTACTMQSSLRRIYIVHV